MGDEAQRARVRGASAWLIVAAAALAFIPPLANLGGWTAWSWAEWVFAVVFCALIVFLVWRQLAGFDAFLRSVARQTEAFESDKKDLLRRVSDSERLLAQAKRETDERLRQSEREKTELAARVEEEKRRAAAQQAAKEEIQRAVAQLSREKDDLATQGAEAIARRQSLQKQYIDLEKTANEVKAAYTEKADHQRRALAELERLRADLKDIQAERDGAQAEASRLRRQIETLGMEQSNAALRETKTKTEAADWKARAEAAERQARNLQANTALEEELSSRRTEIERLCQKVDDLTRQQDLTVERSRLLERERDETNAQLPALSRQIESLEQVIGQLQDECRNGHLEPRHEMDRHFVWRLNFFKEQEVILNFFNQGAQVDLVDVFTEPELICEIPGKRRLGRGAEGRIRVAAAKALPPEFTLKVRYTIYPQEAALRIRPFDSAKIERI
jgi:F0F1-type ATP synthase membrane subunit b/b'